MFCYFGTKVVFFIEVVVIKIQLLDEQSSGFVICKKKEIGLHDFFWFLFERLSFDLGMATP